MANIIMKKLEAIERYSMMAAKDMLTMSEAAVYLGMTKGYLYKLTSTGKVPYYKPNGKTIYFAKAELASWMKKNRHSTNDEAEAKAAAYIMEKGGKL